jgi:hypothetical protein
MKRAVIEKYLVELTTAIAAASALVLISIPAQAQSVRPREIDLAQAERFGLTLPCPKGTMNASEIGQVRARLNAEFQRARDAGLREDFHAERYGLTLPNTPARSTETARSAVSSGVDVTGQAPGS